MKYIVIDVRGEDEFAAGHVEGAINVPVSLINTSKKIADMDRNTPLIVYCVSGARSAMATNVLTSMGFGQVINGINSRGVFQYLQSQ